jgi:dinuclear metal center YbgI/SA1388 family protein
MLRDELAAYLDTLLEVTRFRDYCPNGLQVEGRGEIRKVVCGVTASQALLDVAVARQADAVLVHHGYFWRGEDGRISGIRKARLATLLRHDINLLAYHLPLDAHPELGNNAQLAKRLGWQVDGRFGDQDIGFLGRLAAPLAASQVAAALERSLTRSVVLAGDAERLVSRVAWCTGGAQGYLEQAIAAGADIYVSGEISEQTVHLARESGVPFIAAGHHATERYGVQALGVHLAQQFGMTCEYVELDNPA